MSPEAGVPEDPFQNVMREVVAIGQTDPSTHDWSLGYEEAVELVQDADGQIEVLLELASSNHYWGDGGMVRRSLDAALAVAEGQSEGLNPDTRWKEHGPWPGLDVQISSFASIAKSAHRLDQDPDYIRVILDRGIERATAENEPPETRSRLQAVQLEILAEAAYETGQEPDYLRPLVDRIREMQRRGVSHTRDSRQVDAKIDRLEHGIELARRYGLDDDYIRAVIDEEKGRWWISAALPAEVINLKVQEQIRIAAVARQAGQDRDYVHGILEEGHKNARLGAGPEAYAELARAVHLNDKPGTDFYIVQLLQEGFKVVVHDEDQDTRDAVRSINQLLQAMYEPGSDLKAFLQGQFVGYGVRRIQGIDDAEIDGKPNRVRHGLLNTLLWDIHLADGIGEANGIERKALSYVFTPESEGRPGVLPRKS